MTITATIMNSPKRTLHHGDIFHNEWAGYLTLFIYTHTSGRYCYGIGFTKVNGKWKITNQTYYHSDLTAENNKFPLVGHLDLQTMWETALLHNISNTDFFKKYNEDGHHN